MKRTAYMARGIPEYWIVDLDARSIEVWTPEAQLPREVRDKIEWRHPALGSGCTIDLRVLFGQ